MVETSYKYIESGSGTWTVPPGVSSVKVTLIGAGGGGGGSAKLGNNNVSEGGGGGGGACTQYTISGLSSGTSISYSVGSGGAGGTGWAGSGSYTKATAGSAGGATSFGSHYVNGGKGGVAGSQSSAASVNGNGGSGGLGGSSPLTIYAGGAGGKGGNDGSGYGAGASVSNAGGGGGGLGDSTIYNYATKSGHNPYTNSSANASAAEGGKVGHYGTGGGGDSGFDGSLYGVGGQGGNGLIILEYTQTTVYTNLNVNITNGTGTYDGSTKSSITMSVPVGGTYSKSGTSLYIYYNDSTYATITNIVASSSAYDKETWSSTSGTINSATIINIIFSDATCYFGTVCLGTGYKQFEIIEPDEFKGVYFSDTTITYKQGTYLDVDWKGDTKTKISLYLKSTLVYNNTNNKDIFFSNGIKITSSGRTTIPIGLNCTIEPNPSTASVFSETSAVYRAVVTFNANGGSGGPSQAISDWQSSSTNIYVSWSGEPTRNYHSFLGWATDPNATESELEDSTSGDFPMGETTLYAVWKGDSVPITVNVVNYAGHLRNFPKATVYWSSEKEGDKAHQCDFYANDKNEVVIDGPEYGGRIWCEVNTEAYDPPTPSTVYKDLKTCWYLPTELPIESYPYTISVQELKLALKLIPYSLTINFYKNDGTTDSAPQRDYVWNNTKLTAYSDLGLGDHKENISASFIGWSEIKDALSPEYTDTATYVVKTKSADNVTKSLYAVWGYITQVEFYKDDISGVHIETISTDPATGKLTRSPTDLSNVGELEFKGWTSTAWSGELKSADVASIKFDNTKAGTVYVYGKWSRLKYYPITFVTSENVAYSIPDNTCTEWKNNITYKTKDGVEFNPFSNPFAKWQQYQSSYNITRDYDKELKFSKINNVFYEVSAPSYDEDDNIRMAVSCGKVGTIDLGTIQDISDSYSAMLTTIPVAPFGFSGTFCMDTGVQRSLRVSVVRVSPVNADESSTDSAQWPNAKWIRALKELMDRWQMMTDGVKLHMYIPADRVNNVPPIDNKYTGTSSTKSVNAYITSMPITYTSDSVHKVAMTISFKIGTMYPEPPKLKTKEITVYKDTSTGKVFTYPVDSYSALPRCPSGIISESSELFIGWKLNGEGNIMYPGDPFKVSDVSKLYAQYVSYNKVNELIGEVGGKTVSKPSDATAVTIVAVGGGGAGGKGTIISTEDRGIVGIITATAGGGGGGSGQFSSRRVLLASSVSTLYVYIGKGGQTAGANGEATVVKIGSETGKVLVRAMYGYGGGANKFGGSGGEGYNNGGRGGYAYVEGRDYVVKDAMDGLGDWGGAKGQKYVSSMVLYSGGGGGGGAPPRFGGATGRGGNGVIDKNDTKQIDGTYGGGGGGGQNIDGTDFGKGGDGYVCLIWETSS